MTPLKSWRTKKETTLAIKEETKRRIQTEFKDRVGIIVDVVKQGVGTTNNGNTSRRFFANPSITAEITQVDETLIKRLAVVLEVICRNFAIDADKFNTFSQETARLAISLYPWYYMPATVHKILMHGKAIIECAVLPVRSLSEEAQESRNKDCRYYRIHHTRKCSHLATNQDMFNTLLTTSDPYISHLRPE